MSIIIGSATDEILSGTSGDDSLEGGGGNDALFGVGGNDTLRGGTGLDTLVGGLGDDTLDGGGEQDVADYSAVSSDLNIDLAQGTASGDGSDTLVSIEQVRSGSGNDTLSGSSQAETLYGGAGNDQLSGGDGDDALYGEAGDDSLSGGAGNDWVLSGGAGNDTLDGGDGVDGAHYTSTTADLSVDLTQTTVTVDAGDGTDTLIGIENVHGGLGNDTLTGDAGDNQLSGNDGADSLSGGDGRDGLFGGKGSDTLVGGAGDDELWGSKDNDTLTGGSGNDSFLFNADDGSDTITDFAVGDRIQLGAVTLSGGMQTGDGSALEMNRAAVSVAGGVTTLTVGLDSVAGADLTIRLEGEFAADQWQVQGSELRLVENTGGGTTGGGTTGGGTTGGGTTTPPPPAPEPEPPVTTTEENVDSVTVVTTTSTQDGVTNTTTTIAPVTDGGEDGQADVPLAFDEDGEPVLQVGVPVGSGLSSTSQQGSSDDLGSLMQQVGERFADTETRELVEQNLSNFGTDQPSGTPVTVRTLTFNPAGDNTPPTQPLVVRGSASGGTTKEALVIDLSKMPSGTRLSLDDVPFAVVVGAVRIEGGSGANTVMGDGAQQFIVLGEDDDELHGGGGDDIVGSHGGDDKLYGDAGNDHLVGGIGNDTLDGGEGNDILQGGASDAATWHFAHGDDGLMHWQARFADAVLAAQEGTGGAHDFQGMTEAPDPRLAFVGADYAVLDDIALLFKAVVKGLPRLSAVNEIIGWNLDSAALADLAAGVYGQMAGDAEQPTADRLSGMISHVLGQSDEALHAALSARLAEGASWGEILLTLARQEPVRSAIRDADGHLQWMQDETWSETGFSLDPGDNQLSGGAGDDLLTGGSGNDTLDGGSGTDAAVWLGSASQYRIQRATGDVGEWQITHSGTGATDLVAGIELFVFGGQAYRLSLAAQSADAPVALDEVVQLVGADALSEMKLPDGWVW